MDLSRKAVHKRIAASRATGKLDLSSCDLSTVPRAVWDASVALEDDETPWWRVESLRIAVLHHNRISGIPAAFCSLEELQVLNVSSNELTHLPEELSGLVELRSLVVSKNRLQKLPEAVAALTALVRLDCADNPKLSKLPAALGASQHALAAVAADRCKITAYPEGLSRARGLRALSLASNALNTLPENAFAAATGLTELDLGTNQLADLPASLLRPCCSLVSLSLASNRLQELPNSLGACAALATLDISGNRLRALPDELRLCCVLAELSAQANRLTRLGAGVLTLRALRLLDLRNNDLLGLPAALGHMTTLRAVPLSGNPMRSVPRVVREGTVSRLLEHLRLQESTGNAQAPVGAPQPDRSGCGFAAAALSHDMSGSDLARRTAAQLSMQSKAEAHAAAEGTCVVTHGPGGTMHAHKGGGSGKEISVGGLGLKELPQEVFDVGEAATSLDASRNTLEHVPAAALAALCAATAINFSRNRLRSWPLPLAPRGSMPSMPALLSLDLSGNRPLPPLPPAALHCCAGTLTRLDLSGCTGVGADISPVAVCTALRTLQLDTCGLAAFPPCVSALTHLAVLSLEGNALRDLPPPTLTFLAVLEELNVRNNALTALPPQLALLPRLRSLQVDGNMLRSIRRSVLDRGTPAVLEYLRSRLPL
eukprot:jgi/Ulvmu1/7743/UM039_0051.1